MWAVLRNNRVLEILVEILVFLFFDYYLKEKFYLGLAKDILWLGVNIWYNLVIKKFKRSC